MATGRRVRILRCGCCTAGTALRVGVRPRARSLAEDHARGTPLLDKQYLPASVPRLLGVQCAAVYGEVGAVHMPGGFAGDESHHASDIRGVR